MSDLQEAAEAAYEADDEAWVVYPAVCCRLADDSPDPACGYNGWLQLEDPVSCGRIDLLLFPWWLFFGPNVVVSAHLKEPALPVPATAPIWRWS